MADQLKQFKQGFDKMWPDIKKKLQEIGGDALELAKQGEKQVQKFSKKGKLQVDMVGAQLKREQMYYELGKKTASLLNKGAIKNQELKSIHSQIRNLSKRITSDKTKLEK